MRLTQDRAINTSVGRHPARWELPTSGGRPFLLPKPRPESSNRRSDVQLGIQPQPHKRLEGPELSDRLGTGVCAHGRSRVVVGYPGLIVSTVFGDVRHMWLRSQPNSTTEPKAAGAVSSPSERASQPVGGNQARFRGNEEAEGSFPSPAAEQVTRPAPLLNSERVVRETQSGSAHLLSRTHTSISRHQHAAPVRRACGFRFFSSGVARSLI